MTCRYVVVLNDHVFFIMAETEKFSRLGTVRVLGVYLCSYQKNAKYDDICDKLGNSVDPDQIAPGDQSDQDIPCFPF